MKRFIAASLFIALLAFALTVGIYFTLESYQKTCEAPNQKQNETCHYDQVFALTGDRIIGFTNRNGVGIGAVATIVIALFTWFLVDSTDKLWVTGEKQIAITKEALINTQRAFVTYKSVETERVKDGLMFYVVVENSGTTPTRNMYMDISWKSWPTAIPENWGFPYLGTEKIGSYLGPKGETRMAPFTISFDALLQIQQQKEFFYFWGTITYRDIFNETRDHITKFCLQLYAVDGDLVRGGPIMSRFATYKKHNCVDDECETQA